MRILNRFTFFVIFSASLNVNAHKPQSGAIHAAVGPLGLTTHGIRHAVDRTPLFGMGILIEGDVDDNGGVELALMPMRKLYFIEREGQRSSEIATRIHIVSSYRHWAKPWLSGALGFFSSYAMSDAADYGEIIGEKILTSARDAVEYGFEASVQFEPVRFGEFSAIVDTRYAYSITSKAGEDANHWAWIVAVKYEIQDRGKKD